MQNLSNETLFFLFASKLPVYIYVIYKAYRYRHSLIVISANWLGCLAFFGALSSVSVVLFSKLWAGVVAYGVILSLFMLAYTAREVKNGK
jgi:hypothetical protein